MILKAFSHGDDNHVLLVQNQMDTTTAIVIQSKIQKQCFVEWGDNLVMDWTHSTNNLGYHMGKHN